jgi:crossover junction endodeoxyribonuclease RuvC
VLGIDPGLTRCGIGVVDVSSTRQAVLVHFGVIRTPPDMPLEQRLLLIGQGIAAILDEHEPHAVALERVFAQHNLRTSWARPRRAESRCTRPPLVDSPSACTRRAR